MCQVLISRLTREVLFPDPLVRLARLSGTDTNQWLLWALISGKQQIDFPF